MISWFKKKPPATREEYVSAKAEEIARKSTLEQLRSQHDYADPMKQAELETSILEADLAHARARSKAYNIGVRAGLIEEWDW